MSTEHTDKHKNALCIINILEIKPYNPRIPFMGTPQRSGSQQRPQPAPQVMKWGDDVRLSGQKCRAFGE